MGKEVVLNLVVTLIYCSIHISIMVNEYLLWKDLEHLRRLREKSDGNKLEHMVNRRIQHVNLRQALLHTPEVRAHATTCKNFDIERVHFRLPDQESQFAFQEQLPVSPGIIESPQDQSNIHQQSQHQTPSFSASDENIYGIGQGVPMTCTCGQTITATLGRQESSYLPASLSSSPATGTSYLASPGEPQNGSLYGQGSSSLSRGRRLYS